MSERTVASVLTVPIDVLSWNGAVGRICAWAKRQESRYVCITNVHSVVTATREPAFRAVLADADMATPDGAPVAWMLRRLGHPGQQRINGPDLMLEVCARAAAEGLPIGLYGSTPETLRELELRLRARWPQLRVAAAISPPFRTLSAEEARDVVEQINASGAAILFVSLGCPKQERWMAAHRGSVRSVMLGVGAAFDFHAGTVKRAPPWMRDSGLEWLHRLLSEPRRLWRRYLTTNTTFVMLAARQLLTRDR